MSIGTIPLWNINELYDNMPISLWAGVPKDRRNDAFLVVSLAQTLRPDLEMVYRVNSYLRREINGIAGADHTRDALDWIGAATFGQLPTQTLVDIATHRIKAELLHTLGILKFTDVLDDLKKIDASMVLGGYRFSTTNPAHFLHGVDRDFLVKPLCAQLGHPWYLDCPDCASL